ncbi:discoidin domain-containing protein, partial [bacterium]|nr:discoidin domain-containing protein [bacterium]
MRFYSIRKIAGIIIFFAIYLAANSFSATKTASGTVTDYSVSLYGISGYHSAGFYWDIYFSTFDGIDNAWPQGFTQNMSGEAAPVVVGGSAYRTDYAIYSRYTYQYYNRGRLDLSLPTTDTDGNGFPDVLQIDKPAVVNTTISLTEYEIPAGSSAFSYYGVEGGTAYLSRAAGAYQGTVTGVLGNSTFTGYFSIEGGSGNVVYDPITRSIRFEGNSFSFDVSGSGTSTYTRNSDNQITVAGFNFITSDGLTRRVNSFVLSRSGKYYRGSAVLVDGDPKTSYVDFQNCFVEILDNNDEDFDGIPDLSDGTKNPYSLVFPSGGGAYASTVYAGYPVSNGFDGNDATAWLSQATGFPHVVGYDFSSNQTVNSITLNQGLPGYTTYHATQVQVLGSNDNSTWTDLGTFNNLVFGRNTLTLGTPGSYRYYVLKALAGPTPYWAVAEVSGSPDPFLGTVLGLNPALPATITRATGQPLVLSVGVRDSGSFTYKWYKNGTLLSPVLTGYTDPVYFIGTLKTTDAGTYSVNVYKAGRLLASSSTTVTVDAASVAGAGEDSFSSGSSSRWSGIYGFDAQDSYLSASGGKLNYIVDKIGNPNTQAFYIWDSPLPSWLNWEIEVETNISATTPTPPHYSALRLQALCPQNLTAWLTSQDQVGIYFANSTQGGGRKIQYSYKPLSGVGNISEDVAYLGSTTTLVTLKLKYQADTKLLTSWYKTGAGNFIQAKSQYVGAYAGLVNGFVIALSGIAESQGVSFILPSGNYTMDNFKITFAYPFPSGGGAYASTVYSGYPVTNGFDGNDATAW